MDVCGDGHSYHEKVSSATTFVWGEVRAGSIHYTTGRSIRNGSVIQFQRVLDHAVQGMRMASIETYDTTPVNAVNECIQSPSSTRLLSSSGIIL
jgi:hypothetical protein